MDRRLAAAVAERLAGVGGAVEIESFSAGSGGTFQQTGFVTLADGRRFFLKHGRDTPPDQLPGEAAGLAAIAATGAIRVPRDAMAGELDDGRRFLVMEAIATGSPGPHFAEELGRRLAELHRRGRGECFGFPQTTYCGSTPQDNTPGDDWIAFFRERRLRPLLDLARARRVSDRELDRLGDRLLDRLDDVLAAPAEAPALVHGDLWSGNVLADEAGTPVLVDPAASWSHREHEFGMTRLFGGFGPRFEAAYHEAYPLAPGSDRRLEVYRLYHLLNHLAIFGRSYRDGCHAVLARLVGRAF